MKSELLTTALVLAMTLPACAGGEGGEGAATEDMTELNEAGQAMTELNEAGQAMTELNMAASTVQSELLADLAQLCEVGEQLRLAASTVQSELLADLAQLRDKYVGLAEAMPESAYGWSPGEGVRTVSEVYMHVAAANVGLAMGALGTDPPEGDDAAWYGREAESITDKAAVVAAVGASFDYLAAAIEGTSDEKVMEATDMFGLSSVRAVLIFTLAHCHEHLGQSIAYARSNGVTPPWSM